MPYNGDMETKKRPWGLRGHEVEIAKASLSGKTATQIAAEFGCSKASIASAVLRGLRAMQNEKGDSFEPPAQSSTPGEVHAAANEGDDTSSCPKSA